MQGGACRHWGIRVQLRVVRGCFALQIGGTELQTRPPCLNTYPPAAVACAVDVPAFTALKFESSCAGASPERRKS